MYEAEHIFYCRGKVYVLFYYIKFGGLDTLYKKNFSELVLFFITVVYKVITII